MKLRCRLGWHKWSAHRWLVIPGIKPIYSRGCRLCPTRKVK